MLISHAQLANLLYTIQSHNTTLPDIILTLLLDPTAQHYAASQHLFERCAEIFSAFVFNKTTSESTSKWAHNLMRKRYSDAVQRLSRKDNGWHFSALRATAESLREFRLEEMAEQISKLAPELWDMVWALLSGGNRMEKEYKQANTRHEDDNSEDDHESEAEYWATLDDIWEEEPDDVEGNEHAKGKPSQRERRNEYWAIIKIKVVVVISILMQSTNQRCNALGSVVGIFLHSCNTNEKVIKMLARIGVSISVTSIHNMVHSLSRESAREIEALGRTLEVSYAYDNFDIKFKTLIPTVEQASDGLTHLTSGIMLKLDHGVSREDLRCSNELWTKSPLNDDRTQAPPMPTARDVMAHLAKLHPDPPNPHGLSQREIYRAWQFLHDLVKHGPEYFRQFEKVLGQPQAVEKIPITKTHFIPLRSMDINQSKVSGNIDAIAKLLEQAGVGDPSETSPEGEELRDDVVDISEYVTPIHGDLSTYERCESILERRRIERTPWRRYQFVCFTMGLFHVKMAAVDALWRIFLQDKSTRDDENSLMQYTGILRPKETGKIGSGPEFRQMHEVVRHAGTVLRLDCWRVETSRRLKKAQTLEEFAETKPTFAELQDVAAYIACNYVAGSENLDLWELRDDPVESRDQQRENILIMQDYFLLYEELCHAMNAGDIGDIESLFPPWIALFKATGKHKYATHMIKFMADLHFVYPEKLRHAIRYNMLVNLTGKQNESRAIDWVVELINLFTKDMYGGEGSNYTKKRVLEESPLVLVFRSTHANIERNFRLSGLSHAHATKDMRKTFAKLSGYMTEHGPNEIRPGRKSAHSIADMLVRGEAMLGHDDIGGDVDVGETSGSENAPSAADLSVETSL